MYILFMTRQPFRVDNTAHSSGCLLLCWVSPYGKTEVGKLAVCYSLFVQELIASLQYDLYFFCKGVQIELQPMLFLLRLIGR